MDLHDRIIAYVTNHYPISYEKIVQVAAGKGFSEGEVLAALSSIGNKLKSTVRGGVVYYQVPPAPKAPTTYARPDYPRETIPESPFKVCSCPLTHVHWKPEMGHFKDCDSMVYPEEYVRQNPWDATAGLLINPEEYERVVVQSQYKYGKKKSYG